MNMQSKESPTNIRKPRDLVRVAHEYSLYEAQWNSSDSPEDIKRVQSQDKTHIVAIQPHAQLFNLEIRSCDHHDFNRFSGLWRQGPNWENRWFMTDTRGKLNAHNVSAPPPDKVARLVLSPALAEIWYSEMMLGKPHSVLGERKYFFILMIEGADRVAVQRFYAAGKVEEAIAVTFNSLANGYSVVFSGMVLHEEYLRLLRDTRLQCAICEDFKLFCRENDRVPTEQELETYDLHKTGLGTKPIAVLC